MRALLTSLALCAALVPVGATAQDLTDDELLELFLAQRDALKAAKEGNTSLTRGLTLVTAEDVTVATEAPKTEEGQVEVADNSGTTTTTEATTLVKVPQDMQVNVRIEFEFDSAALTEAQKPRLEQLCKVMKAADIQLFRIVGHTDSSGTEGYNQRLSLLRAEEVQRYFIKDCGIDAGRLEAVGLGERFLLEDFDPKSDQNRRVEFQALS